METNAKDLSKYDAEGDEAPIELTARYERLRAELKRLCAADTKDMKAIDALVVELDEVHAGIKNAQKRGDDPQRF